MFLMFVAGSLAMLRATTVRGHGTRLKCLGGNVCQARGLPTRLAAPGLVLTERAVHFMERMKDHAQTIVKAYWMRDPRVPSDAAGSLITPGVRFSNKARS